MTRRARACPPCLALFGFLRRPQSKNVFRSIMRKAAWPDVAVARRDAGRRRGRCGPGSSLSRWGLIRRDMGRNISGFVEDVGHHRIGTRDVAEPIAMHLDPPEAIAGKRRIGPWMCARGCRACCYLRDGRFIGFDQPVRSSGARRPSACGLKIAADRSEVLRSRCPGDPNRQAASGRPGGLLWRVSGRSLRLMVGQQPARLSLHRIGIGKSPGGDVGEAGVEGFDDMLWNR